MFCVRGPLPDLPSDLLLLGTTGGRALHPVAQVAVTLGPFGLLGALLAARDGRSRSDGLRDALLRHPLIVSLVLLNLRNESQELRTKRVRVFVPPSKCSVLIEVPIEGRDADHGDSCIERCERPRRGEEIPLHTPETENHVSEIPRRLVDTVGVPVTELLAHAFHRGDVREHETGKLEPEGEKELSSFEDSLEFGVHLEERIDRGLEVLEETLILGHNRSFARRA